MPLDVRERVADSALGRALSRAQQTSALTIIVLNVVVLLVMQVERPTHWFWAIALAFVPMLVLLVARLSFPSNWLSAAYLVLGGVAIFTIDLSTSELATEELADNGPGFFAVRLALILCGAAGTGVAASVLWTALGYLASEGAVLAASLALGEQYEFSVELLLTAVIVALLRPIASLVNPRVRSVWQQLQRASADDEAARRREVLEQRAAALVHDTVLGQLHAIAAAPVGELSAELRALLVRSLATVSGDGWITAGPDAGRKASVEWQHTPLFSALQDARLLGLTVDVTGDPTVLGRVGAETSLALGLAAAQCLTNVLKHSGVTVAEVAIYGTDTDVCVMVVDSGKGFDEDLTTADRLGLRSSVKRRIEAVGGRVQVWTTPGQGTSIMLRVPDIGHERTTVRTRGADHA